MNPAPYIGRFAPSPTGPLHFGSLVAAVASWLDARAAGGQWRVRMEDLDRPRCYPGAADTILHQLEAYGLYWDGAVLVQSQRDDAYAAALEKLHAQGAAYACACTRRQLASPLVPPRRNAEGEIIYPGTCAKGLPAGVAVRAWRVRVPDRNTRFHDRIHGELQQNLAREVGDFIIKRADGLFAYQLAVGVDDAFQRITHVVRGADLLWNTPRQIHLHTLLGLPIPTYAHVPLVTNLAGQKLSKQTRAPALPESGRGPMLAQALTVLGHLPPRELTGAGPAALLAWACTHWHIDKVPTYPAIANPASTPDNPSYIPSPRTEIKMAQLPSAVEQVLHIHAAFIHTVVNALRDRSQLPELMKQLDAAEQAGWPRLVSALRHVINGRRDPSIKLGLDAEDSILLDAILGGFDNPATLPPLDAQPDGSSAAPGLAALIDASARGDTQAMSVLANMAEQMLKAGGDMALLGGRMRRLLNGERDADQLVAGMGPLGRELVISLLDELAKLRLQ